MYSNWLDSSLKNVCSAHIVGSLWCLPSRTKRETAKQTGHLPILMATPTLLQSDQLVADGGWRPLLSSQMLRCLSLSEQCWSPKFSNSGALKFWRQLIPELRYIFQLPGSYFPKHQVVWSCSTQMWSFLQGSSPWHILVCCSYFSACHSHHLFISLLTSFPENTRSIKSTVSLTTPLHRFHICQLPTSSVSLLRGERL